ncbi:hypothetical protein Ahy_A01g004898 isoform C [Arachis hypogaea]|uniref:Uncharacterized protein n=1 Tax=Arachis hypogaea TaxID=3818 RepID=A0A445EXI0_ARAHY|nr:hypothetical protein Ahy_A01g004898 isoform C [Arachis hypogaea]
MDRGWLMVVECFGGTPEYQFLLVKVITLLHSKFNQSTSTNIVPTEEKFNSSKCSFKFHPFSPISLGGA